MSPRIDLGQTALDKAVQAIRGSDASDRARPGEPPLGAPEHMRSVWAGPLRGIANAPRPARSRAACAHMRESLVAGQLAVAGLQSQPSVRHRGPIDPSDLQHHALAALREPLRLRPFGAAASGPWQGVSGADQQILGLLAGGNQRFEPVRALADTTPHFAGTIGELSGT